MMGSTCIKAENISKRYCRSLQQSMMYGLKDIIRDILNLPNFNGELRKDEFWALNDISFELRQGECIGIIGPNGAGKSTLLKMLNGIFLPDSGKITLYGKVSALIEIGAGFHPMLSGRENIFINGAVLGMSKKEISKSLDAIIDFAELPEFIDMPVKHYSSGMYVRLGFAIAMQLRPDILLIDEVLAVGDVGFRMKCYDAIETLKKNGTSIIIVSHNMIDIMRVCDDVLLLDRGSKKFHGPVVEGFSLYSSLTAGKSTYGEGHRDYNIENVTLTRDGTITNKFSTGDDIQVTISIKCRKQINHVRINFHIDASGIRLNSTSSQYSNNFFNLAPGENLIQLSLNNICLLQGGYAFYFDLYGENKRDFLSGYGPVSVIINGPETDYFGYGISHLVTIEHQWKSNTTS